MHLAIEHFAACFMCMRMGQRCASLVGCDVQVDDEDGDVAHNCDTMSCSLTTCPRWAPSRTVTKKRVNE